MYANDIAYRIALGRALSSIDLDTTLPKNPFAGKWGAYRFFDERFVFSAGFVAAANRLLALEPSRACCLINLAHYEESRDAATSAILLGTGVSDAAYMHALVSTETGGVGWLYRRDRYVCASEVGSWCIYSERSEDVAVIAFREAASVEKFDGAFGEARLAGVAEIFASDAPGLFEPMLPAWKKQLFENFV